MADQFPCPNPACSHVFTLAELQASGAVGCPRCGFRVQGRGIAPAPPVAPPAPKPTVPLKPAVAPVRVVAPAVPRATPVRPTLSQPPLAQPVGAPGPRRDEVDVDLVPTSRPAAPAVAAPVFAPARFASEPDTPRRAGGSRTLVRVVVLLAVVGLGFCVLVTGGILLLSGSGETLRDLFSAKGPLGKGSASADYLPIVGNARNQAGKDEKAFRLLLAKHTWTADKEIKSHLGALGAWMNKQDDVWLAIAVKDFGMQKPRDAELLQSGIERLDGHFGESLELAAKAEPAQFAGVPAQKLTFKGLINAVAWQGECLMFSHHGFAYWVFLAGPSLDDVEPVETELRNEETGFALATDRKGWREQPPRTESFTSDDGRVTMTAPEGVWERSTPSNVEFETGKLLLLGRYLKEKDNQKNAHLQIFTQEKQGSLEAAMKQAKEYLEKQKKDQNSGYKIAAAVDATGQSELGVVEDVGNRPGRVAELTLSLNETPVRYYLLAVVSEADHVTVILCDCNWRSRQIWRQDFVDLLKTFRVKKV